MSSYYTSFLLEVCQKLAQTGYKNLTMDVSPIYLENPDRSSSGTKYFSYERLGFSSVDASLLARLITVVRQRQLELRAALCPAMAETDRALIMDVRTGEICQFLGAGYGGADSKLIHSLCDLHKVALKLNPLFQKDRMMKDVNFQLLAFLKASRNQSNTALKDLGPDMEGFDRMAEIFANEENQKKQ